MLMLIYHLLFIFNIVLCWKDTFGAHGLQKYPWYIVGISIAILPFVLDVKMTFYYGLVMNVGIFFWSSDSYFNKIDRRFRGVLGTIIMFMAPFIFDNLFDSWASIILFATLGHVIVSGVIGGLLISR